MVVLNCKLGGLAIMRTLGSLGVFLIGVDGERKAPGFYSRYCHERHVKEFIDEDESAYLQYVLEIGMRLRRKAILIPTSDELAVFVADHADALAEYYIFPRNDPRLVRQLMNKEGMYWLARKHGVPTAQTLFPRCLDDVKRYADDAIFPVMLKGILGNRLFARTGKKMAIVRTGRELLDEYKKLEDREAPNLMIQEYIPGGDDQIYIFNGYFNEQSECLAGFTGHKIRQYPIHAGCASLGVCTWNREVAELTTTFMKAIGYKGILDIGYRWDPRDGKYKVLDINPRLGQAFRLFVDRDGMDVVQVLYRDLTGQSPGTIVPREGRRWLIEDYDLESALDYYREGTLGLREWIRSVKRVEEGAWFSWRDPVPFFMMCGGLLKKSAVWAGKKLTPARSNAGRRPPDQTPTFQK